MKSTKTIRLKALCGSYEINFHPSFSLNYDVLFEGETLALNLGISKIRSHRFQPTFAVINGAEITVHALRHVFF